MPLFPSNEKAESNSLIGNCKTPSDLIGLHEEVCNSARELIFRKNKDYGANTDLFRNLRRHGRYGICVRLSDKLARLESFVENNGHEIAEETLKDTVEDIINYAILYLGYGRREM